MKKEIYILIGLTAVLSFALVSGAKAAYNDLGEASTTPDTPYIILTSNYNVSFKTHEEVPNNVQIRLIFPDGFNVAGATATSSIVVVYDGTTASVAASAVSGQEITYTLAANSNPVISATSTVHIKGIPGIVNPAASGSYALTVITRTTASGTVDSASTTAFSILGVPAPRNEIDASAPRSSITSPTAGATISAGTQCVIEGTGSDESAIEKVEVSLDGGKTWFVAKSTSAGGTFSWEYVWQNPTAGEYTIRVRATDSAGNIESPGAGVKVTVPAAVSPAAEEEEEAAVPEKPITKMTVSELRTKLAELQQILINLLQQLIQLLQQQFQGLI